jgi:sortase B
MLLLTLAGYALWDSNQIYKAADKSNYAIYKPLAADEGKSFLELQGINSEVIAWLSVYGTNIDYPVAHGQDNMKYVNTNIENQYSLSGAIFLDCGNSSDFSDFNSIIYGHHMDKIVMFGEIGLFSEQSMFDSHQYGNLYFDGKDHGIEFFAFVHTDAYDGSIFEVNIKTEMRQSYLDSLMAKAVHKRDTDITLDDRIVMLSTCSSSSTNGRDILVGKITEETYEDTVVKTDKNKEQTDTGSQFRLVDNINPFTLLILLLSILLLILCVIIICLNRRSRRRKRQYNQQKTK